jgi:hypothetical protein
LKETVEHEAVRVHCPPQPVADAIHRGADLIDQPPGTPVGFPVTWFFREEGAEFNVPLAEGLVADLNAALVEPFLDIPGTQGETVIQPNGVLDDGHWKAVAVRSRIGHGGSAYPSPIKATQPLPAAFHPELSGTEQLATTHPENGRNAELLSVSLALARIQSVTQPIADEIDCKNGQEDQRTGIDGGPGSERHL